MCTLLYLKWLTTKTYCIAHRTLLNIMWQPGWEGFCGRMDTCICMTESLCSSPETTTTLLIGYSSVTSPCLTLCNPRNYSTPGFPVHHHLPEFTQLKSIESVMPSNHLILCSPLPLLELNLSQHQGLFR